MVTERHEMNHKADDGTEGWKEGWMVDWLVGWLVGWVSLTLNLWSMNTHKFSIMSNVRIRQLCDVGSFRYQLAFYIDFGDLSWIKLPALSRYVSFEALSH